MFSLSRAGEEFGPVILRQPVIYDKVPIPTDICLTDEEERNLFLYEEVFYFTLNPIFTMGLMRYKQ